MNLTAEELCAKVRKVAPDLDVQLVKNAHICLKRFAALDCAGKEEIAFLANPKYTSQLKSSQAQAIVLNETTWLLEQNQISCTTIIVCSNPYAFFAFASQVFEAVKSNNVLPMIHPSASIASSAVIGQGVSIGAYVAVSENARIGDYCAIGSHCVIGANVFLGADTLLHGHVTLYDGVTLGQRCIVHAGAVVGSDGFGFAPYKKNGSKFHRLGQSPLGMMLKLALIVLLIEEL